MSVRTVQKQMARWQLAVITSGIATLSMFALGVQDRPFGSAWAVMLAGAFVMAHANMPFMRRMALTVIAMLAAAPVVDAMETLGL